MNSVLGLLRALGDETRLRLVRLLLLEPALNVGELVAILGAPQPTVSRALGDLRRAGLVRERREGGFVYYQLVRVPGLLEAVEPALRAAADEAGDAARLAEVLRQREDRGASAGGNLLEPGRSWVAWARALRHLIPSLRVADLGAGDGALTVEIAGFAKSVVGVELDPGRFAAARERVRRAKLGNVTLKREDATRTSLRAGSQDLVVLSQLLHHLETPAAALAEARRLLASGGRALVLELAPHQEAWVREKLGHRHMGFAPKDLERLLGEAGFHHIVVDPGAGKGSREPFHVLVATGVKP